MKQKLILSFLLIFFLCDNIIYSRSMRDHSTIRIRRVKIGSAPLALAVLLKTLGARDSVRRMATKIHLRCGSKRLLHKWMRIIMLNKKVISQSTKHPFTLRRFWYIYHKNRIMLIKLFLRTFIKCGRVSGSRKAYNKMVISYASARTERKLKLLKFTQRIKKVFFRKKRISSNKDNKTIYPTYLLKRIVKSRIYTIKCLKYRKICRRHNEQCDNSHKNCKKAINLKRRINRKVKRIFVDYFSNLWAQYISSPSNSRIIYLRRNRNKYDQHGRN